MKKQTVNEAGRKGGIKSGEVRQAKKADLVNELRALTSKKHLDVLLGLDMSVNELEQVIGMLKLAKENVHNK